MLDPRVCTHCAELYIGKMIAGMKWLSCEEQEDMLDRWLGTFDELRYCSIEPFINCPTNVPEGVTGYAYPDDIEAPDWCPYKGEHAHFEPVIDYQI